MPRAPPSWKAEPAGGCPASIIQTSPASVAAGSGTFWTRTCYLQRWTRSVDSLYCARPSLVLRVSCIKTKVLNSSHPYFMAKKKKKRQEKWLMFSCCCKSTKGKMHFFFKLATGQNLQNEGRAFFLSIYLYYICTDFFFSVPKMKENFDIWDARKLRSYFCWLELFWCLGI